MSHRLFYVSQDVTPDSATASTWSVWVESYAHLTDIEPIPNSTLHVGVYETQVAADQAAKRFQKQSYRRNYHQPSNT